MATLTENFPDVAAPPVIGEPRLLIPRIGWDAYVAFGDELAGQGIRSVRLTYGRGRMEIMTIGAPHEWYKEMLGDLRVCPETFLDFFRIIRRLGN